MAAARERASSKRRQLKSLLNAIAIHLVQLQTSEHVLSELWHFRPACLGEPLLPTQVFLLAVQAA